MTDSATTPAWGAAAKVTVAPDPFVQVRAALDVREEEGDGAGGKIRHEPLQTHGWSWCCPIVARESYAHPQDHRRIIRMTPPGAALDRATFLP